jgi:hypothetical protein
MMKHAIFVCALMALPTFAFAQGVKDPSSPRSVIIVNPPQQSRPTATPNIPTRIPSPSLGVRRAHPYHNGARTSGSRRR